MKRRIIKIDESLCNGCGLCANACHEGAIGMVNGKAKLLREDYCDGLGDCLPACPMKAITFEVREAPAYNEAAVQKIKAIKAAGEAPNCLQNFPASSIELSTTSYTRWCRPFSPMSPMYIAGRLRTASKPSRT